MEKTKETKTKTTCLKCGKECDVEWIGHNKQTGNVSIEYHCKCEEVKK